MAGRNPTDRARVTGDRMDWLARFVSSETFAIAFVWWAIFVSLSPLCIVCALEFHTSGAIEATIAFGLFGVVLGVVSLHRLGSLVAARAPVTA